MHVMQNARNISDVEIVKRPWQGDVLGVVYSIGLVFHGLTVFMLILMGEMIKEMFKNDTTDLQKITDGVNAFVKVGDLNEKSGSFINNILENWGTYLIYIQVVIAIMFIIGVFLTRGVFKGKRKSVMAVLVLVTISTLLGLVIDYLFLGISMQLIITCSVYTFIVYLSIVCIKDKYYK